MTGFATGTPRSMVAASNVRQRFPLFLIAFLFSAGFAHAADGVRPAASASRGAAGASRPATGASAPRTPLLTASQLRDCIAQKERLHAQTDDALKDKAAIEAIKAEITSSGTSLAEQVAALDKTSAEQVDAYNARVEARDKLIDGYQAKVTAYNVKAEAVQATRAHHEKSCELRRYDERDLNDITPKNTPKK